ncbi:hypothetical protein PsorP6_015423 [Peronosclerospora sorghi]|uniref:Uncharacterized protein n=1 Tax=Peronosclerospora sorghi TaxID=230839 RepID=A0ACC0WN83_9STRA|nr:hypothetical protein PsorP6_015423 [Peronosclerospora sorghi]
MRVRAGCTPKQTGGPQDGFAARSHATMECTRVVSHVLVAPMMCRASCIRVRTLSEFRTTTRYTHHVSVMVHDTGQHLTSMRRVCSNEGTAARATGKWLALPHEWRRGASYKTS